MKERACYWQARPASATVPTLQVAMEGNLKGLFEGPMPNGYPYALDFRGSLGPTKTAANGQLMLRLFEVDERGAYFK